MRRKFLCLAVLTTGLLWIEGAKTDHFLRAENPSAEIQGEQLKPLWRVGDRWIVETRSWMVQARKGDVLQRGPAVQWQFTVQDQEKIGAQDCLRVEVQCLVQGRAQPVTKLWVDQKSMALRQIQTQLPVAGTFRTVTESYQFQDGQPSPVLAPLTALPIDLPLFLGGQVKGDQTFVYEALPGIPGAKEANDVAFAYEIQQQVSVAQPDQVKGLLNVEFAKNLENKPVVNVQLKTAGRQVRQIWQAGMPWPVFADNGATESRLIKVTRAN